MTVGTGGHWRHDPEPRHENETAAFGPENPMKSTSVRYLYSSATVSFAMRVGGVGLLFLANVLLARGLPVSEYGRYAYAIEWAALGAVVGCLGLDQLAIRVVPDRLRDGDAEGLRKFLLHGMVVAFATAIAAFGLMHGLRYAGLMPAALDSMPAILVVASLMAALTLLRLTQETMRAARRIVLSQIIEQITWPVALLAVGGSLLVGLFAARAEIILGIQAAVYAAGAGALLFTARSLQSAERGRRGIGNRPDSLKGMFGIGLPLAFSAAVSVFLNRGDILALAFFRPPDAIAVYTAASRYGALMVLGLAAVSATSAALMRDYWTEGDREGLQRCVDRATAMASGFALPLAAAYLLVPELLLSVYGPEFERGANVLRILGIAQLLNALTGPVALLVIVCELQREFAVTILACALFMVALLLALIPRLGDEGAALSTLVAIGSLNLTLAAIVRWRTGIRCWLGRGTAQVALADLRAAVRAAACWIGKDSRHD